ncbi:hypothetical protein ACFWBR_31270 [Streptomyces sp. NPDC060006]|uniref:hypothetical protein n=1 Tax=unclassified Streptomyces TaxID=2593676 RepID=UPI0036D08A1B
MLLNPPGLLRHGLLPHWPYAQAVDQALTDCGIPPGTVRVERTGRAYGELMYLVLAWDVSRCAGPGGIQLACVGGHVIRLWRRSCDPRSDVDVGVLE